MKSFFHCENLNKVLPKYAGAVVLLLLSAGHVSAVGGDDCVNAHALTIGTTVSGDFTTAIDSGSDDCSNGTLVDLWYSFTASQASLNVRTDEGNGDFSNTFASVYSGTCAGLVSVECGASGYLFLTGLIPGTTYRLQLQLAQFAPASTSFDLVVEVPPTAPGNDDAPNATALTLGAAAVAGTVYGATDSGQNLCEPGFLDEGNDVFYSFVAPASGAIDVTLSNVQGSDPFPLFSLLRADIVSGSLICEGESFDPTARYTGLIPGNTYYVQVYTVGTAPQTSTFDLEVREVAQPPTNDDCAGATSLSIGTPASATVEGATSSGVDPCASNAANDDVWFSFQATATEHEVYVRPTANAGTGLLLGTHSGTCATLTNIACTTGANASAALTGLTIGDTYFIQVYSFGSAGGERIVFDIEVVDAPANDDCTAATALACGASITSDTRGASSHQGTPSCAQTGVWYSFTGNGGMATITVTPEAAMDVAAELYRGSTCGSLTSIGCRDFNFEGEAETINFMTLVDQTYFLYVGESIFALGKGEVTVALSCAAPPAIATSAGCSGATTVEFTGNNQWKHIAVGGGLAISILDSEPLGDVDVQLYGHSGAIRTASAPFADRNVTITPTTQPSLTIQVRLYYTTAELDDLVAADPSVNDITDLVFTKTTGTSCSSDFPSNATQVQLPLTASGTIAGGYYLQTSVASFSEFFVNSGTAVLPAELISFEAYAKTSGHELNWATASEINVEKFSVQRSTDGLDFETVGEVLAAGNSVFEQAYDYVDHGYAGAAYYRLATVDFDGRTDHSEIRYVEAASDDEVSQLELHAYPNPAVDHLTVEATLPGDFQVFDLTGRVVLEGALIEGRTQLNLGALSEGAYVLRASSGSQSTSKRILITRS